MRIETVNLDKGGGGKSSHSYNQAWWLALEKKKRVLLMDGDHSRNLTHSFEVNPSKTMYDLFTTGETEICKVSDYISIIAGDERLTDDQLDLNSRNNKYLQLFMWISDHYEELDRDFDYLLIDTHNDESLVTANFIAVADIVLGVTDASTNGFRAWLALQRFVEKIKSEAIDVISRKSYVQAQPYLIGNKIEYFGNNVSDTCKQFLDVVNQDPAFLGAVQKKELMARSLVVNQSVFEQKNLMSAKEKEQHSKFYGNIEYVYENILQKLNGDQENG